MPISIGWSGFQAASEFDMGFSSSEHNRFDFRFHSCPAAGILPPRPACRSFQASFAMTRFVPEKSATRCGPGPRKLNVTTSIRSGEATLSEPRSCCLPR